MSPDNLPDFLDHNKRVLLRLDNVFELLDHLRSYIKSFERSLEDKSTATEDQIDSLVPYRDEGDYALATHLDDLLVELTDFYPNILRRALVLAVYSLVEVELKTKCHYEEKQKQLPKSFMKMKVRGRNLSFLEKAEKYLIEEAKNEFPKTPEWTEIDNYRKLRNCIIHNQGTLTLSDNDQFLRNVYIPRHPQYLEIAFGLYGYEVILHRGFCGEVIDTVDTFFQQLYGYKSF